MRILLVYPQTPETFWSFKHVLPFISKRAAFPPLGLLTVAAMLPTDWELKLVDTNVERLRDEDIRWADYVLLSGMIVHRDSARAIIARANVLAKPVIAGGPLFATGREAFAGVAAFVIGEAEEIMAQVIADMKSGCLQHEYVASRRPEMTRSAQPAVGPDPTQKLCHDGGSVLARLSVRLRILRHYCYERARAAHQAARATRCRARSATLPWMERHGFHRRRQFHRQQTRDEGAFARDDCVAQPERAPIGFLTEASVNLADDSELCTLMVSAGFKKVFLGIETPSVKSLEECRKLQNRGRDLVDTVQVLQQFGLEVMGGFIVGFDNDEQDIFKRQFEFIQRSGVVTAMVGLLTALPQSRLYQRLRMEGRLEAESTGNNTEAVLNFKPKLNREFLVNGYRDLMKRLYEPKAYYQRIRIFLEHHRPSGPRLRLSAADLEALLKSFWLLGIWHRGQTHYWRFFWSTLLRRPRQFRYAIEMAIMGYHFRRVASVL